MTIEPFVFISDTLMNKALSSAPDIGSQMEYFVATGNLRSRSDLALQQVRHVWWASHESMSISNM